MKVLDALLGVMLDIITLQFDSRCHDCHCLIPAGTQAIWEPQPYHLKGVFKGKVRHWHGAPTHNVCGGSYTVKAVFHATSQTFKRDGMRAEEVLAGVVGYWNRRTASHQPVGFQVWQGNVMVLAQVHVHRPVTRAVPIKYDPSTPRVGTAKGKQFLGTPWRTA